MKPWLKNRNGKSARVNIFLELLLTDIFRHHLRKNTRSYIDFAYLCIGYLYTYITYTYNYTALH